MWCSVHALDGASIVRGGTVHQSRHDEASAPESCKILSPRSVLQLSWYTLAWALWRSASKTTRETINSMRLDAGLEEAVLDGSFPPETLPRFLMHALVPVLGLSGAGFGANSISDYSQILQQRPPRGVSEPDATNSEDGPIFTNFRLLSRNRDPHQRRQGLPAI